MHGIWSQLMVAGRQGRWGLLIWFGYLVSNMLAAYSQYCENVNSWSGFLAGQGASGRVYKVVWRWWAVSVSPLPHAPPVSGSLPPHRQVSRRHRRAADSEPTSEAAWNHRTEDRTNYVIVSHGKGSYSI